MASTADAARASVVRPENDTAQRQRVLILGILAAVLTLLPLLAARHLPLLDAPGHEARLAALRHIASGRGSDFYRLDSFFLPNIAFDVIGLGLVFVVEPETAGKIFLALTMLLTLSGTSVLNRVAIGRWSIVPLASALLLYNLVTILAFFSYAFGLALMPWALAGRILADRRPAMQRTGLGVLFGVALLFCHVYDFAIYAIMVSGFTLTALIRRDLGFGDAVLRWAEAIPPIVLFYLMSTHGSGAIHYESHLAQAKIFGIVKAVTAGTMTGDAAFVVGAGLFGLLTLFCTRIRLAPGFLAGILVLVLFYFVLPDKLASGSYVDKRMPIAVGLMLLAGLDLRVTRPRAALALASGVALALVVKQAAIAVLWRSFDPLLTKLENALDVLPAGSVLMQTECQPSEFDIKGIYRERQPSMTHLGAMAAFDDSRFVAETWAIPGQQTISVDPALLPFYNLQVWFGPKTCDTGDYRKNLHQIETLLWSLRADNTPEPPVFLLLLRPPAQRLLADDARLVASDPTFEIYEVKPR